MVPPPIRLTQTRTLAQCRRALEEFPASFLVVEATIGATQALLEWLVGVDRKFPAAAVWLVSNSNSNDWQWVLHEAGGLGLSTSMREAETIVEVALRHLDRIPETPMSITDRVWAELPWA